MSIGYGIRFVIGHEKMSCDKTGPDELIHSVSPGEGSLACFFRNEFDFTAIYRDYRGISSDPTAVRAQSKS